MQCPFCRSLNSKVLYTRRTSDEKSYQRRRECQRCGRRFTTFEGVVPTGFTVIKKNGSRERFNREKLASGIRRAAGKRRLSDAKIDEIVNDVSSRISALEEVMEDKEVFSKDIGNLVLERLLDEDEVVYFRFATYFLQFEDLHDIKEHAGKILQSTSVAERGS